MCWFVFIQVLDIVNSNSEGSGALNLNTVGHNEASSSWGEEEGRFVSRKSKSFQVICRIWVVCTRGTLFELGASLHVSLQEYLESNAVTRCLIS